MNWVRKLRDNQSGWTIIEMTIVVLIISILLAFAVVSYDAIKAKVRFYQVAHAFDSIKNAAVFEFINHPANEWAVMVTPGEAPSFVGPFSSLKAWPKAPCPNWVYSWDNFYSVPGVEAVRITIRRHDLAAIFSYCLETYGGSCQADDGFGGSPPDIAVVTPKYLYCNE